MQPVQFRHHRSEKSGDVKTDVQIYMYVTDIRNKAHDAIVGTLYSVSLAISKT